MPGLCAYVGAADAVSNGRFEQALNRMRVYDWFRVASDVRPEAGVGLGAVILDSVPGPDIVHSADHRYTLVLDGELYEHPAAAASVLLDGWLSGGESFLTSLHGSCNAVVWDRVERQLHVLTDRFGLKPIYIAETANSFLVASEIKALLVFGGVDRTLSPAGLAEFFSYGHFLTDQTLLAGVRAVPPATVVTFDARSSAVTENVYHPGAVPRRGVTLQNAAEQLERDLVAAVSRRARPGERLGLSLSGGLDARTLLGLAPIGLNVTSVSIGIDGSIDHLGASELARLVGIPHHRHLLDDSFLAAFETHLREMVRLTDGHYLDQGIVMPTMPTYRSLGIEYLLRGHGGELLHMGKAYAFSLDASALQLREEDLLPFLHQRLTAYMLDGVPADLFAMDVHDASRASLAKALARLPRGQAPIDRVWSLFLSGRLHRETAMSMHKFGCFAAIRMPYIDNDVVDTLAALPAASKMGDELQTQILRRRKPEFLNVVNSNTGARMGAGKIEASLATLRMRVSAKLGLKGYQPYERLGLWLRRELKPLVERVVLSEAFLDRGVVRPDAVRRVVDEHMAGANRTFLLMSLIIFEMGQQMLDHGPGAIRRVEH